MSKIPLAALPIALREVCGDHGITYAMAYRRAIDGVIPVTRTSTNRLLVNRSDILRIAKALGLSAPAKQRQSA